MNSGFALHAAFSKMEKKGSGGQKKRVRPNRFPADTLATLGYVLLSEIMLSHGGHVLPFPGLSQQCGP